MKKLILISLVIVLSLGVNSCGKETSSTTNYTIYQVPVGIARNIRYHGFFQRLYRHKLPA